jgi:hypothetical protein
MPPNNQPTAPPPNQQYQAPPAPQGPPPPDYKSASQQAHDHHKLYLLLAIVFGVLFLGAAGFGVWAFIERNEYKNETEGIVASEVEQAVAENTEQLEAEFTEREKEPLSSYSGPAAFGSVTVEYPKTWSAFVDESGSGSTPLEGYFHPRFVPDPSGDTLIALSVEVVNRTYDRALQPFERAANQGRVEISPIEAENVDGVLGTRVDGEIERDVQGSVVLFELRDKTLILTTQSTEFLGDFNNIILANLEFNP